MVFSGGNCYLLCFCQVFSSLKSYLYLCLNWFLKSVWVLLLLSNLIGSWFFWIIWCSCPCLCAKVISQYFLFIFFIPLIFLCYLVRFQVDEPALSVLFIPKIYFSFVRVDFIQPFQVLISWLGRVLVMVRVMVLFQLSYYADRSA